MKYLKLYEDRRLKYQIGDYLRLSEQPDYDTGYVIGGGWAIYETVKVIDSSIKFGYYIEGIMKENKRKQKFWIDLDQINRKATQEEINFYNLLQDVNKYNL